MSHAPQLRAGAALAALVIGSLACGLAAAQGVYRIVGPDGKVTFSDQPPPAGQARPVAGASGTAGTAAATGSGNAALPFELRRVATQFPVVLYTGKDCAPCNSGRNLLNARGIPYVERTVTTADDAAALTRMAGESSVPVLTIGSQQLRGFSDLQWGQYLDAAGYPKQSQLPASYRRPAPEPMVAVQSAAPGGTAQAAPPPAGQGPAAASRPAEVPVQPPSGIRF